jgi:hypothetical protein
MSRKLFGSGGMASLKCLAAAAVVSLGLIPTAKAASADFSAFGWMADTEQGVDLTLLSTSNNGITLSIEKSATFSSGVNADGFIEPLLVTFRQVSSNAVANISIDDETITNDTGTDWSGFRFIVEGGLTNNGTVPHFDSAASAGFLTAPFDVPTFMNNDKELRATGGTLSSTALSNVWHPGLNAGNLVIAADPFSSGNVAQTFVFKEQPIAGSGPLIPLPAAAWTSLSGLLGLGLISNAKKLKKILT